MRMFVNAATKVHRKRSMQLINNENRFTDLFSLLINKELNMKGLILEGGAMRGMYTAGILDVFLKNNITFDKTVGVSAGAVFGSSYHSKQEGRVIRYNKKYCRDKRYMSLKSLITTGDYFGRDFCYRELPENLDIFDKEAFSENKGEFYVVTTDLNTGNPLYFHCKNGDSNDLEWMRASASLPLFSRIVKWDGYEMLDGGVADSIPIKWMEKEGADKIVAVLTQPSDYVKSKNGMMPLIKMIYRKYPHFIKAMADRHIKYNETTEYIRKLETEGKIFVIRPSVKLDISRTENNPDNLQRVYDTGVSDGEKILDKLINYLEN